MCSTGRLTVKCLEIRELWYVAYMLAYASVLYLTICRITWSLWRGTKEGPYQDRPPLCPFRLLPLLIYSGSTIAFLKILKVQGPKSKNIENKIQSSFDPEQQPDPTNPTIIQSTLRASVQHIDGLTMAGMYKNCTKEESPEIGI